MIVTISGEVGGGKTLTMIHLALLENKHKKVLHNIRGMKKEFIQNQHLLTKKDLFRQVEDENKSNSKTKFYKTLPNWAFLVENKGSTFMIDEAHELFYSRNFSSQQNKAGSMIFAQIRKLCQDSGDFHLLKSIQRMKNSLFTYFIYDVLSKHNNIYVTSQTTSKLEKDIRDLSQCHIHCSSTHINGHMIVFNHFYFSDSMYNALEKFESGQFNPKKSLFYANQYFEMYDRFAIIDMEGEYL